MAGSDGGSALDELFWRGEILQALYWMQGEGFASEVDPEGLARFLVADPGTVTFHMERLAVEGYLDRASEEARENGRAEGRPPPRRYRLTSLGLEEGGRSFHDEFAELMQPGHGECAPGCWCHSPDHAGEPCPSHGGHAHE